MSIAWAMGINGAVFLVAAGVVATIASDTYNATIERQCRAAAWTLFLAGILLLAVSPWWAVQS